MIDEYTPLSTPDGQIVTARDVIIALRGHPTKCDFCGLEKPEAQLHPEEASQWICEDCIRKDPEAYFGRKP